MTRITTEVMSMTRGWHRESGRHALAARGCKTARGRYNVDLRTRGTGKRRHDSYDLLMHDRPSYWKKVEKYGIKDPWGGEGQSRHYNPDSYIVLDGVPVKINAGSSDEISVYRDANHYYVLGENSHLDYASLTIVRRSDKTVVGDQYFGSVNDEYSVGRDLRKDFFDYSTPKKIDILMEYMD
jgi:hypothetical protein